MKHHPSKRPFGKHRLPSLALSIPLVAMTSLAAEWSGLDVDDALWTSPDNWVGGTPPGAFQDAEFGTSARLDPDLDAEFTIGTLRFLSGAATHTLESSSGHVLSLVDVHNASGTDQYVRHGLHFVASRSWIRGHATVFFTGVASFNGDAVFESDAWGAVVADIGGLSGILGLLRVGRDYAEFQATGVRITNSAWVGSVVEIYGRLDVTDGPGSSGALASQLILVSAPSNFEHADRGVLALGDGGRFSGTDDRLDNAARVRLENGRFLLVGDPAGGPLTESIAELSFDRGHSRVEILGSGGETILFVNTRVEQRVGATAELIDDGSSASLRVSPIGVPDLSGGPGIAGETNQPIVPWLSGGNGSRLDFVTFDNLGAWQARALTSAEYVNDPNAARADDNVDVAAPTVLLADAEVNAVRLADSLDLGGNRLKVGSGAVLLVESGAVSHGIIEFGRHGVIVSSGAVGEFGASIEGESGVTFSGHVPLILVRSSAYSGGTFVNSDIRVRTNSAFGDASGSVVLAQDVQVLFEPGATRLTNPVIAEGAFTALDTLDTHVVYSGPLDIVHPRSAFTAVYLGSEYTGGDTGSGYTFEGPITAYSATALAPAPGAGTTGTIHGVIAEGFSGDLFLFKIGAGTTVLTAANTFRGGVLHIDGTLLVNNLSGSGTGTGSVTVDGRDAVLGGTGTIAGNVEIRRGTLAPGSSPGVLTLGSNLTFAGGTTFAVELSGTAAGEFDQVLLTSPTARVDLGFGTLLDVSLSFSPLLGDRFTVMDATAGGSIVGSFAGLPVSGSTFAVTYGLDTFTFAITYNGGSLVLEVIPEAGSAGAWLGIAALALLTWCGRRRVVQSP